MKRKIMNALKNVVDPELGVNVVDLGLIYDLSVDDKKVKVKMTLTSPFCPLSAFLTEGVENEIKKLGLKPEIELVFDPPWTPDKISPKAKKLLGVK